MNIYARDVYRGKMKGLFRSVFFLYGLRINSVWADGGFFFLSLYEYLEKLTLHCKVVVIVH